MPYFKLFLIAFLSGILFGLPFYLIPNLPTDPVGKTIIVSIFIIFGFTFGTSLILILIATRTP